MQLTAGLGMIVLFFAVLVGLVLLNLRINKNFRIEGTWVAVALAPAVIWLLTTGQLSELAGFGLEVKLRRAAEEPVRNSFETLPIQPVALESRSKEGFDTLRRMIEDRTPGLKFELRRKGYYSESAILTYLDKLTEYPFFRYALFVNQDGTFAGMMGGEGLLSYIQQNRGNIVPVIEAGDIGKLPGILLDPVQSGSSKKDALAVFQSTDSPVLPVVDPRRVFAGVVYRDRIISDILLELTARI